MKIINLTKHRLKRQIQSDMECIRNKLGFWMLPWQERELIERIKTNLLKKLKESTKNNKENTQ